MKFIIKQNVIERKIIVIRGQRVILDRDLALLYGVTTGNLNKAVKRNVKRFPSDFMFRLTFSEFNSLTFQFGISKVGRGGRRHLPYAFTEQGVAMLSSVLNSERAIQVNIAIMRVFVKLKSMISANKELANKLNQLEHKVERHDVEIRDIFEAIRQLMEVPEKPKKRIGFVKEKKFAFHN